MTGTRSCYIPPCGGGRCGLRPRVFGRTPTRSVGYGEASARGGYHGGGHSAGLPPSPTLPHKGGGGRRERASVIQGARGSFWISRRCARGQCLLHRGVGKPLAVDRHGVALFCHVTALCKKSLRVVAGIDRESFAP